jgi:uncharacterized protein YdaU (DUF1376 family)
VHYYNYNISDIWAETGHLTLVEFAIYTKLRDRYLAKEEPLTKDVNALARIIHARKNLDDIANVLQEFFFETEEGWCHQGCDEIILAFREKSDKASKSAKKRWSRDDANAMRTHSERNANAVRTQCESDAKAMLTNNHEPITTNQEPRTKNHKPRTKNQEPELSAPVGAASAEPPSYYGALTLEEAQQVIAEYHEKYPYRERINDRHTGEPMSDMDWGHAIMMVWKQDRAKELGLTEKPKDPPKVTIMDTRAAGKVKVERPEDCDEQVWKDWMRVRGRNALTETAWGAVLGEARKAGITPAEAVRVCAERGWRGFRADWLSRDKVSRPGRREEVDIAAIWGRKPEFEREA